jgi:hypothetical protein
MWAAFVLWVTAAWIPACFWAWFVQLWGVAPEHALSWGPGAAWAVLMTLSLGIAGVIDDETAQKNLS